MNVTAHLWYGVMAGLVILLVTACLLSSQDSKAVMVLFSCYLIAVIIVIVFYLAILTVYSLQLVDSRQLLICQAMFTLTTFALTLSILFRSRADSEIRTHIAYPVNFYSIVGLITLYVISLVIVNL